VGVPSTVRRTLGRARHLVPLVSALLLAALAVTTASLITQAQDGGGLSLVNHDREFVERREDSQRPVQPPLRLRDMRGTRRKSRRRRPAGDVPGTSVVEVDAAARALTEQGLRILARLAVRAYLRREASLAPANPGEQHFDNPAESPE